MGVNRGISTPPAEAEFSVVPFLLANPTCSIHPIKCTLKVFKPKCSAEMVVVDNRPSGEFRQCRLEFRGGKCGSTDLAWRT